ncbi:MAG: RnfABCDGE type electron transport complex subunit D, partial [Pseudomonadota bacterium]
MALRNFFDRIERHFERGGKWERYFPIYEMVESFLYTPKTITTAAPHARSFIDMKRIMTYVVISTIPCILMGLYNVGYQANLALVDFEATGWRAWIIGVSGIGFDPGNPFANVFHGALYFLPIYIVTLVAGGTFEVIFATVRRHEVNEGFL